MRLSVDFENRELQEVLLKADRTVAKRVKRVSITGSGPYSEGDFRKLVFLLGIDPCGLDKALYRIIIGREKWDKESLLEVIDSRKGEYLKVYSQELFVEYLASGKDPFDDKRYLMKTGKDHPALVFLSELGFNWPSTKIDLDSQPGVSSQDWPKVGLLKHMGYRVGVEGEAESRRRRILREIYTRTDLPNVVSLKYMQEWGSAKSNVRLEKLANCIAALCRNAKRNQSGNYSRAVDDWESDLKWLKKTFYAGRFRFKWPNTWIE